MRYIGNKNKLLKEIDNLLVEKGLKKEGLIFCDLFSGSGTVSNYFNGFYKIIANDFLDYAYYLTAGQINTKNISFNKLGFNPFEYINNYDSKDYKKGFCYNNFSPNGGCKYFSDANAKKIDFIRNIIDEWYEKHKISKNEKDYLIACLMESVSKVSNVAGVYSAFLKIWDPRAKKEMKFTPIEIRKTNYRNECYCCEAIELLDKIEGDILYVDPPYTPTQYNSQYHVLETIARNDNPKVHGIGKHRDNDRLSNWCKKGYVEFEFENLIKKANFKHIIFSYSDKGLMSLKFIENALKRYSESSGYEFKKISFVKYKNTRAVNREKQDGTKDKIHYEYLFYMKKSEHPKYISPLNYIGGKFDTLDLICENLPNKIDTMYDLFGGGATVSININAKRVIYNEYNPYVVSLLNFLSKTHPTKVYEEVQKLIKKYKLGKGNKESYNELRSNYNEKKDDILLYLLICFGFEHQIRFNSKHEFNNPCGNSGFNDEMYEKIISFYLRCKDIDIEFKNASYNIYTNDIKKKDFVYLDPPYFGNDGAYQDGKRGFNGWDEKQENELHNFIDNISKKKINFMLSNYVDHTSGNKNDLMLWAEDNGYNVIKSNKITKRNRQDRREIIVFNYK